MFWPNLFAITAAAACAWWQWRTLRHAQGTRVRPEPSALPEPAALPGHVALPELVEGRVPIAPAIFSRIVSVPDTSEIARYCGSPDDMGLLRTRCQQGEAITIMRVYQAVNSGRVSMRTGGIQS